LLLTPSCGYHIFGNNIWGTLWDERKGEEAGWGGSGEKDTFTCSN
jgi:hypothetical protein